MTTIRTIGNKSSTEVEIQLCTIIACSPSTNVASGRAMIGDNLMSIDLSISSSNIVIYPKVGDVWYIKKLFNKWVLESRHSYQNSALAITASPGDMVINGTNTSIFLNRQTMGLTSTPDIALEAPVSRSAGSAKGMMIPVLDSQNNSLLGYLQLFN